MWLYLCHKAQAILKFMPHKSYIAFILGIVLALCPIVNNAQAECWLGEVDSIEEKAREEKQKEDANIAKEGGSAQYSGSGDKAPKQVNNQAYLGFCFALCQPCCLLYLPIACPKFSNNSPLSLCILYCTLKIHC